MQLRSKNRLLTSITLTLLLASIAVTRCSGVNAYWMVEGIGGIFQTMIDANSNSVIPQAGGEDFSSMAADAQSSTLYYSNNQGIFSLFVPYGGSAELLISQENPTAMGYYQNNNWLIFNCQSNNFCTYSVTTGKSGVLPHVFTTGEPRDIKVDSSRNLMFWTDKAGLHSVSLVDTTNWETLVSAQTWNYFEGLDIDTTNQLVYWTDIYTYNISRISYNGTDLEVILDFSSTIGGFADAVALYQDMLYFSGTPFTCVVCYVDIGTEYVQSLLQIVPYPWENYRVRKLLIF